MHQQAVASETRHGGQVPASGIPPMAMVFAAGLGTRMRPLTDLVPKPMVPVGGKPLIDYTLDALADAGVEGAVVNVHYLPEKIISHVSRRTRPRIVISDERSELLAQGGGIKNALPELGSKPFFIANTDAFWIGESTSNLVRLAQNWRPDEMDMLLLLAETEGSIGVDWPGDFFMDFGGRLRKRAGGEEAPFVYTGVGIVKPDLFANDPRNVFGLSEFFFAAAARDRLFGLALDGRWLHVGTPHAVAEAETVLRQSAVQAAAQAKGA